MHTLPFQVRIPVRADTAGFHFHFIISSLRLLPVVICNFYQDLFITATDRTDAVINHARQLGILVTQLREKPPRSGGKGGKWAPKSLFWPQNEDQPFILIEITVQWQPVLALNRRQLLFPLHKYICILPVFYMEIICITFTYQQKYNYKKKTQTQTVPIFF